MSPFSTFCYHLLSVTFETKVAVKDHSEPAGLFFWPETGPFPKGDG